MADTKWSQFPSATPVNADEVVGLHSGDNARFSIANIVAAVRNGLASIFVPLTRTINSKALSTDISLDSSDINYDNTGSGLTATDVQDAIDELAQGGGGGGESAANVTYDPTTSGATATNVQDALDEAFDDLDGKQSTITASGILKGDGQGGVSAAVAGTDYQAPLTAGTDYATPAQLADKANQAQLGYPETGTTASQNYSAGEYICWNGLTYTADTNIALGATLSASGGNKNLTECVGGGLNAVETYRPGDTESVAGLWAGIAGNNGQIDACVPMTKRIPTGANVSLSGLTVAWVRSTSGTASATYLGTSILGNNVMVQFTISGFTAYRPYFIYITAGTVTFS